MKRTIIGTRFTTGCGHSWKHKYPWHTRLILAGCTTDCSVCGELLIIPVEQFRGEDLTAHPAEVHMPLFHKWLHESDPKWPKDGKGAYSVGF